MDQTCRLAEKTYCIDEFNIFNSKNAKELDSVLEKLIQMAHRFKDSTYLFALLMLVYDLPTIKHGEILVNLVKEHNKAIATCLDVAKMNVKAIEKLYQECPICLTKHPKDVMITMAYCNDMVCHACFIAHYTLIIKEKSVKHFNCLVCGKPDVMSWGSSESYLQRLGSFVQFHMSKELNHLCIQKMNTHILMKNSNFQWCINCPIGFIVPHSRQMVECPNCRQ